MKRGTHAAAVTVLVAVAATGCGAGDIQDTAQAGAGQCTGSFNVAVNPWVGYQANAYVLGHVAADKLGCKVSYLNLKEQLSWAGFKSGQVDMIVENWRRDDLGAPYLKSLGGDGTATDLGETGNKGIIGWYVPPWLAKEHPDILQWKNLNKYATQFRTSESGDAGQLLDGDPSYTTNDEALVDNLDLNFKVVYAGSETALIEAFRKAEANRSWVIGYLYEPLWFMSEVPAVKVELPAYTEGCDADPAKVACDYPVYNLNKVVATKWADAGGPQVELVRRFEWTNDDQNLVAKYIAKDGMTPDAAAVKWIAENPAKVNAWLGQ